MWPGKVRVSYLDYKVLKYKVHQPIRLGMIVGCCVVIQRVEVIVMGIAVLI